MDNTTPIQINTPLTQDTINNLKTGQMVEVTGHIYTARDAAHKRMIEHLEEGKDMPFEFEGNIVFYAGPSPTQPGDVIGSVGPTTAGRMDLYAPVLIEKGLKAMMGKGIRTQEVVNAIVAHKGVYFAGIGGIAALMSQAIKEVEIVAYDDLGTEAIRKLTVEKFPCIVAVDVDGNDVYSRKFT